MYKSRAASRFFPWIVEQFDAHASGKGLTIIAGAVKLVHPTDLHTIKSGGRELAMDKGGRSYRFNLRVSPDWMARVREAAERLGISMADFVIMTVNERLGSMPQTEGQSAGTKRTASGKGKKRKDG
jgi:hypothetical protein